MGFIQQIIAFTQNYGVWGLGIGMFLESLGIPFASALLTLTAGTLIASGTATYWEILLITTSGLVLGSIAGYYIGYWGGALGRYLHLPCFRYRPRNMQLWEKLQTWGEISIIFAQWFGTTRTWISIPAGAMRMKVQKFILYTFIGGSIYCALAIAFSIFLTGLVKRFWAQYGPEYLLIFVVLLIIVALLTCIFVWLYRRKRKTRL
ncbi:MAG: DedA family protein [Firmicutes bacterium]|nr:DedA family protein [Bacillota bacterium]